MDLVLPQATYRQWTVTFPRSVRFLMARDHRLINAHLPWHQLLRRVFAVDALVCPMCLGAMMVVAYISDPAVAVKILAHLGLPTTSPALAPARRPAQAALFEDHGAADAWQKASPTRAARGPPRGDDGERWVDLDPSTDVDPSTENISFGAGDTAHVYSGVDCLVAYWLARYHNFMSDDRPGVCTRLKTP